MLRGINVANEESYGQNSKDTRHVELGQSSALAHALAHALASLPLLSPSRAPGLRAARPPGLREARLGAPRSETLEGLSAVRLA